MTTVAGLYKKYGRVNLMEESEKVMIEQSKDIIFLNQYQLFTKSVDANDTSLAEYKSKKYAAKKARMNPNLGFGKPDLKLRGGFYNRMTLSVNRGMYEVDSKDSKSPRLKKLYGNKIFGLTRESKGIYARQFFIQRLINRITNK